MPDLVISVENLSKCYLVGHKGTNERYQSLRDSLVRHGRNYVRKTLDMMKGRQIVQGDNVEEFWALKDVAFDIPQGQVVGIIGRNGAGKSTLLKILSRITDLTTGKVTLNGRVAALLEVGTGFHPELTGRENIYLNGAILGMGKQEIRGKFDEIVAFSGVERFLDTPVKRYSSGMQTRLAFAVAAHLDPEILIIDEVLAVGDHDFQRKCLGKMREVSQSGRTVLFVSHNLNTITSLTSRCLLLKGGRLVGDGPSHEVVKEYLNSGAGDSVVYEAKTRPETPYVRRMEVHCSEAPGVHLLGAPMMIDLEVETREAIRGACLSINIVHVESAMSVQHLWLFDGEVDWCRSAGLHRWRCRVPRSHLYLGEYALRVHFAEGPGGRKFEVLDGVCSFEVGVVGKQRLQYPYQRGEALSCEDFMWEVMQSQLQESVK
jgi:lipopolysaccharide transport system ATP-binding protein